MEIHAHSRGVLRPDPEWDPVLAIFYYLHNDWPCLEKPHGNTITGVLAINLTNGNNQNSPVKQATVKKSPLKSPENLGSPRKQRTPVKMTPRSPGKNASQGHLTNLIGQFLDDSGAKVDSDPRPFLEHCGLSDVIEVRKKNRRAPVAHVERKLSPEIFTLLIFVHSIFVVIYNVLFAVSKGCEYSL